MTSSAVFQEPQFHFPDSADPEQLNFVIVRLTSRGMAVFESDLRQAEVDGGPEEVASVLYGWYRTAFHAGRPGFFDRLEVARRSTSGPCLTDEDWAMIEDVASSSSQ